MTGVERHDNILNSIKALRMENELNSKYGAYWHKALDSLMESDNVEQIDPKIFNWDSHYNMGVN